MCARKLTARIFEGVSPVLQFDPLLRKADEASERLDKAVASGDPFSVLAAKDAAMRVVNEMAERLNVEKALSLIKSSYSTPQGLFEASPGAAPSLVQSSNAGSAPQRTKVPIQPSVGSITSPSFPYGTMTDGRHPILDKDDLGGALIHYARNGKPDDLKAHIKARASDLGLNHLLPPDFRDEADKLARAGRLRKGVYSPEQRRAAALAGHALDDGSHVIKDGEDLADSIGSWRASGSPKGKLRDHIKARAKAIAAECPPDIRG
jgi:hypothetical protein